MAREEFKGENKPDIFSEMYDIIVKERLVVLNKNKGGTL